MLSKAGLTVLGDLSSGREATLDDLLAETGYSRTHLYRVLDGLLSAGLLTESRGHHNQRHVRVTNHPVVEAYRHLTSKLGHVEWATLLSPATVRVCWYLDDPRRVAVIAERLNISRQGVHSALSPLKNRAMLSPAGPEYALADDMSPLLEFVRAVVVHEHRTRARSLAPSATVEWCDPIRALIRVSEPDDTDALQSADDWQLTGLAKFREFGLQFFLSGEPAFWYAPTEVTLADVVCHTLVLDSSSRRVSYAMLLIETKGITEELLTSTARWYGLKDEVSELYRALDGDFEPSGEVTVRLPSEPEYSALKAQYVDV
ncbi:MarR family transcriptional regulator [Halobium palmae]|uniref:MarR family transcriptional regulator n=1 Tax=Halobium palmae TaxID=1776492 RepID=A0ABD5RWD4_9EURY